MSQLPHEEREKQSLETSESAGHEVRDLSIRAILLFGVGLIIMSGLALLISTGVQIVFSGKGPEMSLPPVNIANVPATPALPPEPRLEAKPGQALQEVVPPEEQKLNSYGWIDQKAGVVHIPIQQAMDLIIQRGLPARPANEGNFADKGNQSPSYSSSGREPEKYP